MTPEDILSYPPTVLSEVQRADYFEHGYIRLEAFGGGPELECICEASDAAVARARTLVASNMEFALEPGHTAATPRPRRLYRAVDENPVFWSYAAGSRLLDLVADLVGPDVRYREAYINYKWAHGGDEVKWHQDFPFFPHTNRAILTAITYLTDVVPEMGPIMVIPGSHRGDIFDHYDGDGAWAGSLSDADIARVSIDKGVALHGPAGTVLLLDCCLLHASKRNETSACRPALIIGYSSADAFPYTAMPPEHADQHAWQVIRGNPAPYAHHEPIHVKVPPDWSRQAYATIFEAQRTGHDAGALDRPT